jgi:hypothetical protein
MRVTVFHSSGRAPSMVVAGGTTVSNGWAGAEVRSRTSLLKLRRSSSRRNCQAERFSMRMTSSRTTTWKTIHAGRVRKR